MDIGFSFSTGIYILASRHPTAMHKAFIAVLKQVKTGKFDADGDEL